MTRRGGVRCWQRQARGGARRAPARGLALLLLVALVAGLANARAPRAVAAATCEVPGATAQFRPAATPEAGTPAAELPVIQVDGEGGTPVAASLPVKRTAAASPVAGTPLAPAHESTAALAGDLKAASDALAACLTKGDAETVTLLASERYLGQLFGSSVPLSRDDYVAIAAGLTAVPTRIVDLDQVAQTADDRATAVVTEVVGNQVQTAEWTFELAPAADRPYGGVPWRLAQERQLPVEAPKDASAIDVAIDNRAFTLDTTAAKGPDVVLRGTNGDSDDHEMLVLRLAAGYTTDDLLRATGPDLPREVTYIGEIPIRAGGQGTLALVDLKPGVYTIVCLFPDPQGTPHLADGMKAEFTVR